MRVVFRLKPGKKVADYSEFSHHWFKEELKEFVESQNDFSIVNFDDWK